MLECGFTNEVFDVLRGIELILLNHSNEQVLDLGVEWRFLFRTPRELKLAAIRVVGVRN
jgi:hypothetical protein